LSEASIRPAQLQGIEVFCGITHLRLKSETVKWTIKASEIIGTEETTVGILLKVVEGTPILLQNVASLEVLKSLTSSQNT